MGVKINCVCVHGDEGTVCFTDVFLTDLETMELYGSEESDTSGCTHTHTVLVSL